MTAFFRSELLKVRTTRAWWAYLIVIVLLTGIGVAGEVGTADEESRSNVDFQLGLIDTVGIAVLIALLLGITIVTTEFRHGTVTPTFLVTPRREQVLGAKAVAGIVVALGFALLSLAVVAVVAVPWLAAVGAETHLGDGEFATRSAQQLLSATLWVLTGVAIGSVVHSQVASLVGTLVWIFLGETLLAGIFRLLDVEAAIAYLPFRALDAADGSGGEELLTYGPGIAVSLAWVAVLGGLGVARTRRRDIT